MEQTLGKRIVQHRKRMGLTQDALAEKLGITAQAVSKWENDQSCPDISMLPRLAEIFGITTDALLGAEPKVPVYEAEVVNENEQDTNGLHVQKGNWEFHWDSGRKNAVTFAICVLWVGVTYLLARWFDWDVSFWDILWPSALLIYGFRGLFSGFSVFSLGCALFGGYYLVSNMGFWQLNIAEELFFPICVVLFGLGLLLDALRKPKKPKVSIVHNGGNSRKTTWECHTGTDRFACDLSFGNNSYRVDLPVLAGGEANASFGELTVDLTGCQAVTADCVLEADCSFGQLILLIPRRFAVQADSSTSFANVNISGHPDSTPVGVIRLDADVSFGEILVRYV